MIVSVSQTSLTVKDTALDGETSLGDSVIAMLANVTQGLIQGSAAGIGNLGDSQSPFSTERVQDGLPQDRGQDRMAPHEH
jgi:hypothetical protein